MGCLRLEIPEVLSQVQKINTEMGNPYTDKGMADIISAWMDANNTDEYPTVYQLRKHYFDSIPSQLRGIVKIVTEYNADTAAATFAYAKSILGPKNVTEPHKGKSTDGRGRSEFRYTVKAPEEVITLEEKLSPGIQTSLFSFDKDTTQNEELNRKLKALLNILGVDFQEVSDLFVEGATGQAGINKDIAGNLYKFIKLVEGQAGTGVLAEETVHMVIEMLPKNGLLFQSMYKQISDFQEYQDVKNDENYKREYGDDDYKMRKEAIGKLVSKILIDKNYDPESKETKKVLTWWEKVLQFFGKKFGQNKSDIKAFKDFAEKMLSDDITGLNLSDKNAEEGLYYNLGKTQKEVLEAITNKEALMTRENLNNSDGSEPYYTITVNGQKVKIPVSVTQARDKKFDKSGFTEPDAYMKSRNEVLRDFGIKVHKDLQNIVERINDPGIPKQISTDSRIYSILEKYIENLVEQFPEGTIFKPEIMVADKNNKMASTIDLLIVEPDGTVSILDWKSIVFTKEEKEVYERMREYKEEPYRWQLGQYRRIAGDYGIKKFRYLRLMPIEVLLNEDVKNKSFTPSVNTIKVGNLKGNKDAYLNPVPLESEPGNKPEKYDEFVRKLTAEYEKFEKIKASGIVAGIEKTKRLSNFMRAIREIQINGNLVKFAEFAMEELENIQDSFKENNQETIDKNIKEWHTLSKLIRDIYTDFDKIYNDNIELKSKLKTQKEKDKIIIDDKSRDAFNDLIVSNKLSNVEAKIRAYTKKKLTTVAQSAGVKDYTAETPEMNMVERLFKGLNLMSNPVFKMLWNLVSTSKEKTRIASNKLWEDIKSKTKGLSQSDYDKIINPDTGNLINPYSQEYYDKINTLVEKEDWKGVRELVTIDEEGLKKYIAEKKKEIEDLSEGRKNKFQTQTRLKRLTETTDIFNNPSALKILGKGGKNYLGKYIQKIPPSDHLKTKYYSKEYNSIRTDKNLHDFYLFFKEKINEFKDYLPVDIKGNFVPNLEADLLERALNDVSGLAGKEELMSIIYNQTSPETNYSMGEIDETTGEYKKSIPMYFVKDVKNKSKDLPKLLYLFGQMSYNYKNMEEIEHSASLLRDALMESRPAVQTGAGETKLSEMTNKILTKSVSLNDLQTFDDFVGYYLYGKRFKENLGYWKGKKTVTDPKTGEKTEVETAHSKARLLTNVQNWYSKAVLGLNPVSGLAAIIGSTTNAFFTATKGKYFTKTQLLSSIAELAKGPAGKGLSIVNSFDLADADNSFMKANQLSSTKLNHYSVNNTLMVFLRTADNGVANAVLLSVLQNHGLDSQGNVKLLSQLPEKTKSIYDQIEIKDGENNLKKILAEEQFSFVRNKTYRLMEGIVGMSGRQNMNGIRLSIWGNLFMQFKNWMPMMIYERGGELNYDQDLDSITEGKYRVFLKAVINKRFLPMMGEALKTVIGMKNSEAFDEKLRELYEQEFVTNATLDPEVFTFEAYKQMYIENLRSTITEAGFIIMGSVALVLARGGDEPKNRETRFLINSLNRVVGEFTFFMDPDQAIKLAGSSMPVATFIRDLRNLGVDLVKEGFGEITDNQEIIDKARPKKYIYKLLPVMNQAEKWFEISQN